MAKANPSLNERIVEFGIDGQHNLTCSPAVVHVQPNWEIVFRSKNGEPFAVQSKGVSPLEQADIPGIHGSPRVRVRGDAEPGVYSFACALYANNRIYMDAACPAVIVDW